MTLSRNEPNFGSPSQNEAGKFAPAAIYPLPQFFSDFRPVSLVDPAAQGGLLKAARAEIKGKIYDGAEQIRRFGHQNMTQPDCSQKRIHHILAQVCLTLLQGYRWMIVRAEMAPGDGPKSGRADIRFWEEALECLGENALDCLAEISLAVVDGQQHRDGRWG